MTIGAWSQACLDLISWCDTSVDIDKSLNIYFTSRMKGKPYSGSGVLDIEQAEIWPFILGKRINVNDSYTLER